MAILRRWYDPYRRRVRGEVEGRIQAGASVLHLSVHTFTPVLEGRVRDVDVGLLYDPAWGRERAFCLRVRRELRRRLRSASDVRVRMNQPYQGRSDGLTTALRRDLPEDRYLGIELEINQALVLGRRGRWLSVRGALVDTLAWAAGSD
jgi:predicted N-formylglutamate amidohydrolase